MLQSRHAFCQHVRSETLERRKRTTVLYISVFHLHFSFLSCRRRHSAAVYIYTPPLTRYLSLTCKKVSNMLFRMKHNVRLTQLFVAVTLLIVFSSSLRLDKTGRADSPFHESMSHRLFGKSMPECRHGPINKRIMDVLEITREDKYKFIRVAHRTECNNEISLCACNDKRTH